MKLTRKQVTDRIKHLQAVGFPKVSVKVSFDPRVGMEGLTKIQVTKVVMGFGEFFTSVAIGMVCTILRRELQKEFPNHKVLVALSEDLSLRYAPFLGQINSLPPTPWEGELLEASRAQSAAERENDFPRWMEATVRLYTLANVSSALPGV